MPYLVVENGSQRSLKVEIPAGGRVGLGRDPKSEIPVTDHLCSRRHFEVAESGGRYVLKDLESSNGTWVNEQRVTEVDLAHGDCVRAGETQLTFLEDAGAGGRGLIGKVVGGYRILERIGRGGMGTVYKANQVSLNRVVALKILSHKVAMDPAFVKRFHKEAQAAGRLNHPNIVQVYDVSSDQGLHFFSMEFIENGSVQDLATREGKLAPELALASILDAARGLEYAEKRGLVHRDIKPDNLMINAEGVVKIADLGLARDAGESARETGEHAGEHHKDDEGIFGTPHFIAPEQAQGRPVDTRSDIYSLGATFYRLLTGQTPFTGDSVREIIYKQINEPPQPVREIVKDCPASLAQIVERMMQKEAAARPATAAVLVEELERISAQLESGGKSAFKLAAAAVVLLLAGGGIWWLNRENGSEPPVITGPTTRPEDDETRKRLAEELRRQELENQAQKAVTPLRVENGALKDAERDLPRLEDLLRRFQAVADNAEFAGTETVAEIRQGAIARITAEIAEQKRKNAEAAEQKRLAAEAAARKVSEAVAQADAAAPAFRFGAAIAALLAAKGSPELAGAERAAERQTLDGKIAVNVEQAKARAATAIQEAKEKSGAGSFDEAAAALDAVAATLLDGAGPGEASRLLEGPVGDLRREAEAARKTRDDKIRADAESDRKLTFEARRRAMGTLATRFDPEAARALLEECRKNLRTAAGREALDRESEDVAAFLRVREAFVAEVKNGVKNAAVQLPSQADPSRLLRYTLLEAGPEGFSARLGQGKPQTFAYHDFKPAALYETVFKGRLPEARPMVLDAARMLVAAGDPEAALALLNGSAADDECGRALKARAGKEAQARAAMNEIRVLEKAAAKEPRAWLEILPKVEEFLTRFRDTAVYILNGSGA